MAKVLEILKPEYMSSEESEADDEPFHKIIKYSVRKLPWESRSLQKPKRKLDRLHHDSLSELIKRRVTKTYVDIQKKFRRNLEFRGKFRVESVTLIVTLVWFSCKIAIKSQPGDMKCLRGQFLSLLTEMSRVLA